jgi:hypothetical protein
VLLSAVSGWLSASETTAAVRYVDALTAWGSVFATWLVARKVLENWLYWIVLDCAAAGLYWSQGLIATAVLFVLYSAIAVQGYRSWRSSVSDVSARRGGGLRVNRDPHEARVRALLRAHPEGLQIAEAPFVPIGGGAFNRCWRADTAEGPRFVRLAGEEARRLGADWDSELALLRTASRAGLAPVPLLAVPAACLLVTEYIHSRAPADPATAEPARLRQIGTLLRAVHRLAPTAGTRLLDFATQARRLEAELDRDGPLRRVWGHVRHGCSRC